MKDIQSKGTQLFNIPNNEEGLAFLNLCNKYINRHCYIALKKRGRNSNRPKNCRSDIPIAESEWIAAYPRESTAFKNRKLEYEKALLEYHRSQRID